MLLQVVVVAKALVTVILVLVVGIAAKDILDNFRDINLFASSMGHEMIMILTLAERRASDTLLENNIDTLIRVFLHI